MSNLTNGLARIQQWQGHLGPAITGGSGLVLYGGNIAVWPTANKAFGMRYVAPVAGTIDDISFFVGTAAGTYDVAIYDDGSANAGKKTFLYHKGSTALGATGWISNNPALVVKQGQHFDVALGLSDATTAAVLHTANMSMASQSQLPSTYYAAPGGALSKLAWGATSMVPLVDQTVEASFTTGTNPAVIFLVHLTAS